MNVKRFVSKVLQVNVYIYYDDKTKDGIIIDPSGYMLDIYDFIEDEGINLKAICLTHGHFDHIGSVFDVKEKYNIPVVSSKEEVPILSNKNINLSSIYMRNNPIEIIPDIILEDNEIINFGTVKFKNILTPGHSIGSTCFYDDENNVLFSGDTLFEKDIGRVDLELSVPDKIFDSIKNKLFVLNPDTAVYPGHGSFTTIGYEIKNNPYTKFI